MPDTQTTPGTPEPTCAEAVCATCGHERDKHYMLNLGKVMCVSCDGEVPFHPFAPSQPEEAVPGARCTTTDGHHFYRCDICEAVMDTPLSGLLEVGPSEEHGG